MFQKPYKKKQASNELQISFQALENFLRAIDPDTQDAIVMKKALEGHDWNFILSRYIVDFEFACVAGLETLALNFY